MDILLINDELNERIDYWKTLVKMQEKADTWTKCPYCGNQLYWCHCPELLAYQILLELMEDEEE